MLNADVLCTSQPETEREELCREVGLTLHALFGREAETNIDAALSIRGANQELDDIAFWEEVKKYLERFRA